MLRLKETLDDKVRGFSAVNIVKLKNSIIKVPKLKNTKKSAKPIFLSDRKSDKSRASSIIESIIKNAVESAKNDEHAKKMALPFFLPDGEEKSYVELKEDKPFAVNGGYGTISKEYGSMPTNSYVDYGKLFAYVGKFKSKSAYENANESIGTLNNSADGGSFALADRDSMDKIGRFEKYMKSPSMDMPLMALSAVPVAGLSSGEWEEIKMMMKFDPVLYALKTKTS